MTQFDTKPWRFCTAPMMDWSDRHCRYFWRLMTKHARLYTEMVTTGALIHGDRSRFLGFSEAEHPIALQLGGSDPKDLAQCAQIAEAAGFDEINLNCGCPSDRVQEGKIGACLMAEPDLVAACYRAMAEQVNIPITVKHRLGIDELDSQDKLLEFAGKLVDAGCQTLIVHARKAWLQGLSPKQNREVPPLQYERVFALKQALPETTIVINGGIVSLQDCQALLEQVDGVMLGREAYHNPYLLAQVDQTLFEAGTAELSRYELLQAYSDYCEQELSRGTRLHQMTRHILGIFAAQPGGRLFRQHLSRYAPQRGAGVKVLHEAIELQRQTQQRTEETQALVAGKAY